MKTKLAPLFLLLVSITFSTAFARIGETPIQFANRYGGPKDNQLTQITDKSSPLLEGAIHHTYDYEGWKIRAAFLQPNGPALRMTFQKSGAQQTSGVKIRDDELQAIAGANLPTGMKWEKAAPETNSGNTGIGKLFEGMLLSSSGAKVFKRTDGAILSLGMGAIIVTLELPQAAQHEAGLKAAKEQKAKQAVPKF